MSTAFTWAIADLEREAADGYVFTACYEVSADDGAYASSIHSSLGFERPPELIPFASLAEDVVIGWVKQQLGNKVVAEIEANLQARLDAMRTPVTRSGLPWAT